jgi:hypothetical protein
VAGESLSFGHWWFPRPSSLVSLFSSSRGPSAPLLMTSDPYRRIDSARHADMNNSDGIDAKIVVLGNSGQPTVFSFSSSTQLTRRQA